MLESRMKKRVTRMTPRPNHLKRQGQQDAVAVAIQHLPHILKRTPNILPKRTLRTCPQTSQHPRVQVNHQLMKSENERTSLAKLNWYVRFHSSSADDSGFPREHSPLF